MKIIDFHTHTFPEKLAHVAIASLEKSSSTKASLDGTNAALLSSMKKYGIEKSVLMPIAVKPGNSHTINTCAIENNKIPGFVSFGSVHPLEENYIEELERIKKAGLPGIKLHPDFQKVFIDAPETVAVMRAAADMGLLITIHSGMDVSFPELHRSTPKRLASVLPQLKGAKIICAHSGGYRYNDDVLELLVFNPNKVYSRENLLNIVWGYEYPGDVRTVDVHIRRLREKIEENPSEPKYVHTKWGVGYYFQG